MADVFISYSRLDKPATERLVAALGARERSCWVDWEGIPPSAEWWREIEQAIEAANAFIAVCTPDWLASEVCRREFEQAVEKRKRIVPVVLRDIAPASAPPALARLNWIFLREADRFDAGIEAALTAIDVDFDWVRQHTRLLVRAGEWEQSSRREASLLLRGADLKAAEAWLVQSGQGTRPDATELQRAFLLQSRSEATRRKNRLAAGLGLLSVAAIAFAVLALVNARRARIEAAEALSRQLAAQSTLARAERADQLPRALLLAAEAMRRAPTPSLEADQALRSLLAVMPRHRGALPLGPEAARMVAISGPAGALAWALPGGATRIWPLGEPASAVRAWPGAGEVRELFFDAGGTTLTTFGGRRSIRVEAVGSGKPLLQFELPDADVAGVATAPRGEHLAVLGSDGLLRVLDASGRTEGAFEVDVYKPQESHVLMRFSPDGLALAVSSVKGLRYCALAQLGACAAMRLERLSDKTALAFSPDGRRLAVDADPRQLQIFDVSAFERPPMQIERAPGRCLLRFSPDGRWLALGAAGSTQLQLWDSQGDGAAPLALALGDVPVDIDFAPDASRLVVSTRNGTSEVRELPGGRLLARLAQGGPVAFMTGGATIVTVGDGALAHRWDADAGDAAARLDAAAPEAFGFGAAGEAWAAADAASGGAVVSRWAHGKDGLDGRDGVERWPLAGARAARVSADGRIAWAAQGDAVAAWDATSKQLLGTAGHAPPIDWPARLQALRSRHCSLRDRACADRVDAMPAEGSVEVVGVSRDGSYAATTRADDVTRIWHVGAGQPAVALSDAAVLALTAEAAVLAVGKLTRSGTLDDGAAAELRVHALPAGSESARLPFPDGVRAASLAPSGTRLLVVASNYALAMLELPSGRLLWRRPATSWPRRWVFSGDGRRVAVVEPAAADRTETVLLLDSGSGEALTAPVPAPDSVLVLALSADGHRLALGSLRDVHLYDDQGRAAALRMQHAAPVTGLVFSHDGRVLASASEDGTVRLGDLALGREIARIVPAAAPERLAFAPEDRWLAVGTAPATGGAVQLYAWRVADLIAEACRRSPGDLPPAEWQLYLGAGSGNDDARACRSVPSR